MFIGLQSNNSNITIIKVLKVEKEKEKTIYTVRVNKLEVATVIWCPAYMSFTTRGVTHAVNHVDIKYRGLNHYTNTTREPNEANTLDFVLRAIQSF